MSSVVVDGDQTRAVRGPVLVKRMVGFRRVVGDSAKM